MAMSLATVTANGQALASDRHRIEVSAGIEWQGGSALGTRDANETTGSGGSFRLFSAASKLTPASGLAVRITVPLMRRIAVEATGRYGTRDIATRVSSDAETSNAPMTALVGVKQFAAGAAALWYPGFSPLGRRATVFVRAGAALDRRLEDDGRRIVDAALIEAGGGLKYLLAARTAGWWRTIGARGDIMALARGGAGSFDAHAHISPALGASLVLGF
jgi:hypothetical protein